MEQSEYTLDCIRRQGDKIMVSVNWFLFAVALAFAPMHSTWGVALLIGLPAAGVPSLLYLTMPGTLGSRLANATAFMVFSGLTIHQAHGMVETHFGIFALLAFLLYYRDWMPIVIAAGVIAVHHLLFNQLQQAGYPIFVFPTADGLHMVLVHAAYVVFESVILVYLAIQFRSEAQQAEEIHRIGQRLIVSHQGNIDLTYRTEQPASQFAQGFNAFMRVVHDAMRNATDASDALTTSGTDMITLAEQAHKGVQEQKSEINRMAEAVQEMASVVQSVARDAEGAALAASDADDAAKNGRNVVTATVDAIQMLANQVQEASEVITQLASDSENIGAVLDVIKGIAEQTNLLALNAAIEAARAGEQGRGFAVVADEVRTLASRTRESTNEIQEMIERLQAAAKNAVNVMQTGREQASAGVTQAADAGKALEAITTAVATIRDMNVRIASAAEEQSAVASDINVNIENIRRGADASAESTEQTNSATAELGDLAARLQALVKRFKV